MFDLNKLVRPNVKALTPYSSARDEFDGVAKVCLDANENALGSPTASVHTRYPDPLQKDLKAKVSDLHGIDASKIFISNGSDESIDLVVRAFVEPHRDSILTPWPSYGMYEVSAGVNAVAVKKVSLRENFELDVEGVVAAIDSSTRIVFICNPNNPTGNAFKKAEIEKLVSQCCERNILVVIDEAYIDFCYSHTSLPLLERYPNLIVLQTFSKAWGLAEARVGKTFASKEIVSILTKIKAPYNVSGISQKLVLEALSSRPKKDELTDKIIKERDFLVSELGKISAVKKIFPSDASFLLVSFHDAKAIYNKLLSKGIVVRDRSSVAMCEGCLRISVGNSEENRALIGVIRDSEVEIPQSILNSELRFSVPLPDRNAEVSRATNETVISVALNLDGSGHGTISTGLAFFDHMLSQISKHGGFDLSISVKGDLHVDEHHTIEDTAIAFGEAFAKALGDKRGIQRYSFVLPMDESLSHVALDLSGRSFLIWKAEFKREKIGDVPCEMFSHFFRSFCDAARCNLSIQVEGENEHHKIEAIFKAFSKTLALAVKRDGIRNDIPSTKGVI